MATLQVVTGFTAVTTFGKRISGAAMGGRKSLRVTCQRSFVEKEQSSRGENDGRQQEAVDILQSSRNPLLNLPREHLMAALDERGVTGHGDVAVSESPLTSSAQQRRRVERVNFTAEKARLLRKENRATQTFHDKWYHSAIASKLAMPE